jgi:tetratricopeptide (TPR) repeat protein
MSPLRLLLAFALLCLFTGASEARRVALVIGQSTYERGLSPLDNPTYDAARMATLLAKHGFEVIACDGRRPGCFDLGRDALMNALARLEREAAGADMALVFFAGHGVASAEGNILAPTDAGLDCTTGAVRNGVPVERMMQAASPARHKLLILDACRNNPIGTDDVCPNLKGKKLSFTRIEAGAMQGLLLVTSTQFGQLALDGLPGSHSPFAASLFAALEANPRIYFDQVMNEVARTAYKAVKEKWPGFDQIPGRVVGGAAPADCLTGRDCIGDGRMAGLAEENERLAADASGVRNLLADEENVRGKSYTPEERGKRVAELQQALARMGTSTDPLRQEAHRLIEAGSVADGQAKLDVALDAEEKAIAETERVAAERRQIAARSARDLAVLARGSDVAKAVAYYRRATLLDPADAATWSDYGWAATEAGRTGEAKTAFEQAAVRADAAGDPRGRYWAVLGLGDIARTQGSLADALRHYRAAEAAAESFAKANPGDAGWQSDLSASQERIGNVLLAQGNLASALPAFQAVLATRENHAKADPGDPHTQRGLALAHGHIGEVFLKQRDLPAALAAYQTSVAISKRLAENDPGNTLWQTDLTGSHNRVGDVLYEQRNFPAALTAYQASLAIAEPLARADIGNAGWQSNLSASHHRIGEVLAEQGDMPGALAAYRTALTIRERLAKSDPENAEWQREVAWSHWRVGEALARQGARDEAAAVFTQGQAIILRLRQLSPDEKILQDDVARFEAQLAKLKK